MLFQKIRVSAPASENSLVTCHQKCSAMLFRGNARLSRCDLAPEEYQDRF